MTGPEARTLGGAAKASASGAAAGPSGTSPIGTTGGTGGTGADAAAADGLGVTDLARHPAVDAVTGRAAIVLQDRAVVPLSAWLADAARACAAAGVALQLVTPRSSRLTLPLRLLFGGAADGTRWVVDDGDGGYYDGFDGRPLAADGSAFAPAGAPGEPFTPAPGFAMALRDGLAPLAAVPGRQLLVTARVRHAPTATAPLGQATARLFAALTGAPPAGWGTAEPAGEPWRAEALAAIARRRAPRPSWFVVVGAARTPALATVTVERGRTGVDEVVTLGVGHPGPPPLDALPDAVFALCAAGELVSLLAQVRPGRPDLTLPPTWEGLPVPAGIAIGPTGLAARGLDHALAAPVAGARALIADGQRAAWFPLGDGESPEGWERLRRVVEHVGVGGTVDELEADSLRMGHDPRTTRNG